VGAQLVPTPPREGSRRYSLVQTQAHLLSGTDCRARREELELSRSELARRALVDEATIYRLETGGARVSDLTRRRLAAAFDRVEEAAA
jgi:predicted transcriptional regulator